LETRPLLSGQPAEQSASDLPEAISAAPGPEPTRVTGLPTGNSVPAPTVDPEPPPQLVLPEPGGNATGGIDPGQPPVEPVRDKPDRWPDSATSDSLPSDKPASQRSLNEPLLEPADPSSGSPETESDFPPLLSDDDGVPHSSVIPERDLEPARENGANGGQPLGVANAVPPALRPPALSSIDHSSRPQSPPPEAVLVLPESSQGLNSTGVVPALGVAQKSGSTSTLSPVLRMSLDGYLDQISSEPTGDELRNLLIRISQYPIPVDDPKALAALRQCLTSGDKFVRENAFQMMILLSTRIETPILRDMLLDQSQSIRWKAYNVLIGEPREELLDLVVGGMPERDRNKIVGVLRAYGTRAEKPVHPLLKSLQPEIRIEVARLLGEIGTAASLSPLKAMADDETLPLVERLQAKAAIGQIESRRE
jgi:HEAT repeats